MTDLGFGLADKRSVITVLFVFVLSNMLFKHPFPVDLSNAQNLFLTLIYLTAFLFFARTITRIIIILLFAIARYPLDIQYAITHIKHENFDHRKDRWSSDQSWEKEKLIFKKDFMPVMRYSLSNFFKGGIFGPINEKNWKLEYLGMAKSYPGRVMSEYELLYFQLGIMGIVDRICLIGIAFLATIPNLVNIRNIVSVSGLILMLITYLVTGRFTLLLLDAVHKSEIDYDELKSAAHYPNINFPSPPSRSDSY